MLRKLEHGNWKHNLVDFERPGDKVWGQSIDFEGRMSSMRSMEAFEDFRRTSKGEGFKGSEIWEVTNLSPEMLVYLVITKHSCTTNSRGSCGTTFIRCEQHVAAAQGGISECLLWAKKSARPFFATG